MILRCRYILPNRKAITLTHVDFGLYVVAYNGKTLREFHCRTQAKYYYSSTITFALSYIDINDFKRVS